MKLRRGFTLIEVMVVVAIIGSLSAVLYMNFNESRALNRDQERQADLRLLQNAIELYRQRYGTYPAGCRGAGVWSGQVGTSYACASGGEYIVDVAPEFIPSLPTDPKLNGNQSGYVYTTNVARTVYKLMARLTVEQDTALAEATHPSHAFKSCDVSYFNDRQAFCDATHPSNNKPNHCDPNHPGSGYIFRSTYGVWGGIADGGNATIIEQSTEDIICDIP